MTNVSTNRLLENGVPISVVASIMGWSGSTIELMSKRYGDIGQPARAEAMKHLNAPSGFWLRHNSLQCGDATKEKIH